ncbi:MAG: EAL domain-containing protein [Magnetococcus sp. MYC-9]
MSTPSPPRPRNDGFAIRRPLLLPLVGILLCLLGASVLSTIWLIHKVEIHLLQRETQALSRQLQQAMTDQAISFKQLMLPIAGSERMRQLFLAKDRAGLLQAGQPILDALRENGTTHFYFHRPDRTNFLRVHKPDLHDDPIDRVTLRQAEQSGGFAFGAEMGAVGTLTLRAVLPWREGNRLIGYLELGKEIEHFVVGLQSAFGQALYTFLHRHALDAQNVRRIDRPLGIIVDWESFAELVFIGPRGTRYPEGLRDYIAGKRWHNETPEATLSLGSDTGGAHFFALPIHDIQGKTVGRVIGSVGFAQYDALLKRYSLVVWGVISGAFLLLSLLLNRLLARQEAHIQQQSLALQRSSEQLTDSQLLLNNTLESLEDGILVLNGQAVRFANSRFATLWHLPEELRGTTDFSPVLACMQQQLLEPAPFLAHLQESPDNGQTPQGRVRGRDEWVLEYHSFPVPCRQEPCDRVWVFHDISRHAAMERQEAHALQSRIAISALLETGLAPLTLEEQLQTALEIILAVPWLSLEYKGSIFLLEEAGEQLVMAVQRGLAETLLHRCAQVAVGYCLCGRAAQRREVVFAAHVDEEHETRFPAIQPHGHYCVPILLRERLLGVLNLYVPDGYRRNPEEEAFLTTVSYTLANLIERRAAEQHLLEERQFSASLLATAPALVVVLDLEGRILLFNHACQTLTGYLESEMIGRSLIDLLVPAAERPALQPVWENLLAAQTPSHHENHWQAKNGELFLIAWSNNVIRHSDGSLRSIIATGVDITAQRQTEEMLQHVAGHDVLTGLPNRALFQARLSEHLSMASRTDGEVALMFLDLDRFKQVNDTMGHKMGDQLLKEATQRILSCVRSYDLVARLGGDEFTILLPQMTHIHYVEFIARRILEELARPFQLPGGEAHISGSIGITLFPRDAQEMESLLKNADTAMYSAKTSGRNAFCFFTADMQAAAMERLHLEEGLRAALHNQEFALYYQPKLALADRQISGMEALLRWQRPGEAGVTLVSPAEFIPLAEETGLIVPLGAWVLATACRQNQAWQAQGLPPMRVAVNLSATQFRRPEVLLEAVTVALRESGLDPAWLELEITESMVMEDEAQAVQTMRRLQEMGIAISMDDFGTGYSSLGSLRKFPIHALKIDRSFIRNLSHASSDEAALVQAILSMAKTLRLRVIAEGVETQEQWRLLQEQGCDEIQGYCFSHPLTVEASAEFLRRFREGVMPATNPMAFRTSGE